MNIELPLWFVTNGNSAADNERKDEERISSLSGPKLKPERNAQKLSKKSASTL
jgi:hypothetical protein